MDMTLNWQSLAGQPVFYLFVGVTFLLAYGYFHGRRRNREIVTNAFSELAEVIRPVDQTYTNIGGAIGYHAVMTPDAESVVAKAEATLTLLPRQAWLYLPISLLLRRWDRLYLMLGLRHTPPAEGHLIEAAYGRFRGPSITNERHMTQESVRWGDRDFNLMYTTKNTRKHFMRLMEQLPSPDGIKHLAFVPHQKRCFVFIVPSRRAVKSSLAPVLNWLQTVV